MKHASVRATLALVLSIAAAGLVADVAADSTVTVPKGWSAYGKTPALRSARPVSKAFPQTPGTDAEMLVQGTVADVCQAKGCWMTVEGGGSSIRVEFKDYGFFVPSDITGRRVRVQGIVQERSLSEAEREHIAAESASGKAVPERIRVFIASGVLVQGMSAIGDAQRSRIEGHAVAPITPPAEAESPASP